MDVLLHEHTLLMHFDALNPSRWLSMVVLIGRDVIPSVITSTGIRHEIWMYPNTVTLSTVKNYAGYDELASECRAQLWSSFQITLSFKTICLLGMKNLYLLFECFFFFHNNFVSFSLVQSLLLSTMCLHVSHGIALCIPAVCRCFVFHFYSVPFTETL